MRIAVVSGGTKGIGRAISEKLLQNGCKVYVIARTNDNKFTHENLIQYTADFSLKSGISSFTEFLFSSHPCNFYSLGCCITLTAGS